MGAHANSQTGPNVETFRGHQTLTIATFTLLVVDIQLPSYAHRGRSPAWPATGRRRYRHLDDGSTEKIRCRATYAVGAGGTASTRGSLASDSYKFDLGSNVIAEGGSLSGTWSESSRASADPSGTRQQRQVSGCASSADSTRISPDHATATSSPS